MTKRMSVATSMVLALLAVGLAACATPSRTSAQAGASMQASAAGWDSLRHDGIERNFLVHDFSQGRPAPLVIVLHGAMGNGEITADMTQFDQVARREGLIAVYPNGTGRMEGRFLSWNAGHCCAYAFRNQTDDIGFLSALIDHMIATRNVDADRVYLTGLSNGGMMVHRAGVALSHKVAAIAPVIGAVFGDEAQPSTPMPTLIIVGAEDRTVPGAGGAPAMPEGVRRMRAQAGDVSDRPFLPASAQADFWARANDCAAPETTNLVDGTRLSAHRRCRAGAEVLFYVVANNGHAWPGGRAPRANADPPTPAFNASETIWAFFSRHQRR